MAQPATGGDAPKKRSSVEVAIRVRPMRAELSESKLAWDLSGTSLRERSNPDSVFTFDHVYGPDSSTRELYERSVKPSIIQNVAKGYNGTVFAYGQTGSGKSHTMLGDGLTMQNEGVVTMAVRDLFVLLEKEQQSNPSLQIDVFVTMIEIYNEQLRDLFSVDQGAAAPPLSIRENEHGVYVHNAQKRRVRNARECLTVIHKQAESRVSAATAMNERSSRSHCVIRILVEKLIVFEKDDTDTDESADEDYFSDDNEMKKRIVSTLNLVDLAGSERVSKTGATGQRMVEGGHINKSLTILTTVINRLSESAPNTFVPYRDSRLTHILKTALGGNSFTTVFCCMTAAVQHVDESRSTLQFAQRAKKIKNNVMVNEVADSKTKLRELEIELKKLKKLNVAMTLYLWSKNLKIKNLTEQLFSGSAVADGRGGGDGGGAAGGKPPDGRGGAADETEQLRMIIEQLTAENEKLAREVEEAYRISEAASVAAAARSDGLGAAAHVDPMGGTADDDEKRQLRMDLRDMEQMMNEVTEEKSAMQQSLDELDDFCKELEEENATHTATVKDLQTKLKAYESQVDASSQNEDSLNAQVKLLREQLEKTEKKLMDKAHGDAYLEELTKLHVQHQKLEFEHNQLLDLHSRESIERTAEVEKMKEKVSDLEDEKDEIEEKCKLQNSLLWRLLSVASLASQGKPIDPEDTKETVRETQVEAAVQGLTAFVSSRMNRPPTTLQSNSAAEGGGDSTAAAAAAAASSVTPKKDAASDAPLSSDAAELQQRIKKLEEQVVLRDAQRDIIIDTKLKRIQDLVLKLHTANAALTKEMTICYEQNEKLFDFIRRNSKLEHKLSSADLFPLSLETALERTRYALVPQKPYGHN